VSSQYKAMGLKYGLLSAALLYLYLARTTDHIITPKSRRLITISKHKHTYALEKSITFTAR